MQYIVVTAKHHEGFALFDTNYDRYNCVTGAPFGRDLIAELAEACAKHHMKLGLYYSQELDWHEPTWPSQSGCSRSMVRWTLMPSSLHQTFSISG